jgi:hypothetical protein
MNPRASLILIALVAFGCATPDRYQPGPDSGTAVLMDGPAGPEDAATTSVPDGPIDTAVADVDLTGAADAAWADAPSTPDAFADRSSVDQSTSAPPDAALSPDLPPPLLANGADCSSGAACKSGTCEDKICCAQSCGVCERCVGPSGTCESIPADQRDESPPNTCGGTRFCDGQNPPRCLDCAKCGGGNCIRNRWTFDSGTLEGATVDPGVYAQSPGVAQAPSYLGKQSLAMLIPVEFTGAGDSFYARFHVCSGATADLRTRTFRMRVFLENVNQAAAMPFWLHLFSDQQVAEIAFTTYSAGSWIALEGKLPMVEDGKVANLILSVGAANNPKWSGQVWVDDVRID